MRVKVAINPHCRESIRKQRPTGYVVKGWPCDWGSARTAREAVALIRRLALEKGHAVTVHAYWRGQWHDSFQAYATATPEKANA